MCALFVMQCDARRLVAFARCAARVDAVRCTGCDAMHRRGEMVSVAGAGGAMLSTMGVGWVFF